MKSRLIFIWPSLLVLLILGVGVATWAWSDALDIKGSVQVSAQGAATAILSAKGDRITVRDNAGNVIWTHTPDKTYNRIALSDDGKYIAAVGGGASMLSVSEQRVIWRWDQDGNNAAAITPSGEWMVAGGYTGVLYLFSKNSFRPARIWPLGVSTESPKSATISDDGQTVAVVCGTGVYLFDSNVDSMKWTATPSEKVDDLKMTGDGRYLLGIAPHSIYLWARDSGKVLWQKSYGNAVIGASISANGDKIAVSHSQGVSVLNTQGQEVRRFDGAFGDSDLAMSSNGQFIYVNDGSKRLYAFDDSYSHDALRPYRIIQDINAGSQKTYIATTGLGHWYTYPKVNLLKVEEAQPAVLALNTGVPLLAKDQEMDMSAFVTNPSGSPQTLSLKVAMSLPSSVAWWSNLANQVSQEPVGIKSKLLNYVSGQLQASTVVHAESLIMPPSTSRRLDFSIVMPDLAKWATFADYLDGIRSNMNQAMVLERIQNKLKTPLATLIGDEATSLALATAGHAINLNQIEIAYPVLGLGTVTLYDYQNKAIDQDSFYFMYIKR
ncbi:MAG: hypothetical protein WC750_05305 [Patescibacteria group bacterium]|jgi:hypothetical protein